MPKRHAQPKMPSLGAAPSQAMDSQMDNMELKAIAVRAYEYWEARGRPSGSPDEDWLRAEREIKTSPDWPQQLDSGE